jgi:hypothetical protein
MTRRDKTRQFLNVCQVPEMVASAHNVRVEAVHPWLKKTAV